MATAIGAIQDALVGKVDDAIGRVYDYMPDEINVPCAVVVPIEGDYNYTIHATKDKDIFHVIVLVNRSNNRSAQNELNTYLTRIGATSIKAAIEADKTLGSVVHWARVMRWERYGDWTVGGKQYLGVQFVVEVLE